MVVTAADIPQELFPNILGWVDDLRGWEFERDKDVIQQLAACVLVCRYWSEFCRPSLWERITAKSLNNLNALRSVVSTTPASLTPIPHLVQKIVIAQTVDDYPWIYDGCLRFLFYTSKWLLPTIVLNNPAGSLSQNQDKACIRSIFPRNLPRTLHCSFFLALTDIRFASSIDVERAVNKWFRHLHPWSCNFQGVKWDTTVATAPSESRDSVSLDGIIICAAECTDNAWIVWATLTSKRPERDYRGHVIRRLDPRASLPLRNLMETFGRSANTISSGGSQSQEEILWQTSLLSDDESMLCT